jgi:hypothetical protein
MRPGYPTAAARIPALGRFPSRTFAINQARLQLALAAIDLIAWTQHLLLRGDLAKAEPKKLRYPTAPRRCPHHPIRPPNPPPASPTTGPGPATWSPRSPA